jgi:LmbE family N-acetylglucosaminyl deacetylase
MSSTEELCDETIELVKRETNPYRRFVAEVVRSFEAANHSEQVKFSARTRPKVSEQSQNVLIFSPHPDDECITGGLALRLLRELNMNVINVAVTLGSNKERREERYVELTRACNYLGFDLVQMQDDGLEKITPVWRDKGPDTWSTSVKSIAELLRTYRPRVIFFPHSDDGHETHKGTSLLVQDALSIMENSFSCYAVETEYWRPIDKPNLMVESSEHDVVDLVTALSYHAGEVIRNPYHLRLPAWMIDNVRRGSELISGQGGRAQDFTFATIYKLGKWKDCLLMDVLDKGRYLSISDNLIEIFSS